MKWLRPKGKDPDKNDGLTSPLLPSGSEDDPPSSRDFSGPLHHPEVTAATFALSNDQRRRRSSAAASAAGRMRRGRRRSSLAVSANQRRQRRMQNIQDLKKIHNEGVEGGTDELFKASRNYTEFASVTSDSTHPTSNARNSSLSRWDSEMTDYGTDSNDGDTSGEDVPREPMSWKMMAKVATVILVTIASVVSYGAGLVGTIMLSAPEASTVVVGVAGGVSLLTAPLVWVSEWRLTHMPSKFECLQWIHYFLVSQCINTCI